MTGSARILNAAAVASCVPMFFVYRTPETLLYCVLIAVNTIWRIAFPVQYVPARQSRPGFFFGPVWARCLATVAELSFYYVESLLLDLPIIFYISVVGEIICWLHIYFQSELGGVIEDCTWTFLQAVAVVFGSHLPTRLVVCLPFVVYMALFHLPRMSKRLKPPHLNRYEGSVVLPPDDDTMLWVGSSLIAKPIAFAWFLYFL